MNKQQAQQLIQETFETMFDKVRFSKFVRNLLNHIEDAPFTYQGNYIPEKFRQYIKSLERIGKYNDGEHTLDILIITLQKETSLERARTMQRNFIAWYLNGSRGGEMKDAALVAFVAPGKADWRFSLVKMDYKFEKTETGKMKIKEELTPARRWSFLVGANEKSHTAQSRLVKILADDEHAPTLAELEEAFNIETVTKEFFLKYRELFIRTKDALDKVVKNDPKVKADFETQGVDTVNFAKKLLGQIVFLYFLQKKGWFGVGRDDDWGTGSKQFLRELFEGKHDRYQNFFNDILEPLFYEALRIDRSYDDDYYSRFNCKIPFLNGGLFDPIGNYDWVHVDIFLPNDLFSNTRRTKEGDTGDGILDVFDRYNFTVREDEPLEKEVAIDPELLGKAYEKFNAIRPDNFEEFTKALKSGKKGEENKFNKKFGVYYTPREIVHYMCKQSLINYLYTQAEEAGLSSAIKKQDIEDLIEVGEMITEHEATALVKQENIKNDIQKSSEYTLLLSDGVRKNAAAIDTWLEEITVCDPAVGSGAFPVGMMTEIVRARNVLSVFLNNQERSDYEFKRRCIEHSLYGVDIDPGAVEIAKLRLWLSLVVDEEDVKNIKPLPNLDYKIMQGNSLISEFMGINFDDEPEKQNGFKFKDEIDDLIEDFQRKKDEFLNESNVSQKTRLKNEVEQLLIEIFEAKLKQQKSNFFNRLKDIENKYSSLPNKQQRDELVQQEKEKLYKESGFDLEQAEKQLKEFTSGRQIKPFFLWKLYFSEVFHNKGGFDVVIANPPYVSYGLRGGQKMTQEEKKILRKKFPHSAEYKISLYAIFMDRGLQIAKPNGGIETYITPDSFLLGRYFSKIRTFILRNSEIINILLLPFNVFEATVGFSVVYLFQRKQVVGPNHQLTARLSTNTDDIAYGKFRELTYSQELFNSIKYKRFRLFFNKKIMTLVSKIETGSDELGNFLTGRTGVRSLIGQKNIIANRKKGESWQRGLISGSQIVKYKVIDEGNYVNIDPKLLNKGGWDFNIIHNPKILVRQTGDKLIAAIDYDGYYHLNNIHSFAPNARNNRRLDILYLLGLFNSRLLNFYYKNISLETERAMAQTDIETLETLPVKVVPQEDQAPLITLVSKILAITKDDDYLENSAKQAKVREYEKQIDQLVYKLYSLTAEEIRIVENDQL